MNRVFEHTAYLTGHHDCVVLPGWGALIAVCHPASYDRATGVMTPPSRSLSFNSLIDYNDGLLASSVARREGVGYNAASAIVARELDEMRAVLTHERTLAMPRVGVFSLSPEGTMLFEPAADAAANSRYAMLSDIILPPTADESAERREAELAAERRRSGKIYVPLSRNIFKIAASLMMFISLGWMMLAPVYVDNAPAHASLAPSRPAPKAAVVRQVEAEKTVEELAGEAAAQETRHSRFSARLVEDDPYCLVIGSLGSQAELDRWLAQIDEEMPVAVCRHNGRYRVYIATGTTAAECMAQKNLDRIAERYPDAWVTRR